MEIQINGKILTFSDKDLDEMLIQVKKTCKLYKFKDCILNIYNPLCKKNTTLEENFSIIKGLKTERILIPKYIIRNPLTSQFEGYALPYKNCKKIDNILNKSLKELLIEFKELFEDIIILSNYHLKLNSLTLDDIIYDDKLYFINLGNFEFDYNYSTDVILKNNLFIIENFIIKIIYSISNLNSAEMLQLRIQLNKLTLHSQKSILDILKQGNPNETLKVFTKELGNKKVS